MKTAIKRTVLAGAIAAIGLVPTMSSAQLVGSDINVRSSQLTRYKVMQLSVPKSELTRQQFAAETSGIRSCADLRPMAKELGGSVKLKRGVSKRISAKPLLDAIEGLEIGEATRVYTSSDKHFVLVMCGVS
jgi:hypothetical protein